jgi:hypothetical protein
VAYEVISLDDSPIVDELAPFDHPGSLLGSLDTEGDGSRSWLSRTRDDNQGRSSVLVDLRKASILRLENQLCLAE